MKIKYASLLFFALGFSACNNPAEDRQSKAEIMVKNYLDSSLKDPESYKPEVFGKLDTLGNGKDLRLRHKYRAKNSFGGYNLTDTYFLIDSAMTTVTCCQTR